MQATLDTRRDGALFYIGSTVDLLRRWRDLRDERGNLQAEKARTAKLEKVASGSGIDSIVIKFDPNEDVVEVLRKAMASAKVTITQLFKRR